MTHQSENTQRLRIREHGDLRSVAGLADLVDPRPAAYFLIFPFGRTLMDADESSRSAWEAIKGLTRSMHSDSVIAVLTTPADAAVLWMELEAHLRFQLWVAVRLNNPIPVAHQLPQEHAALLILSKYSGSLRHTKTRIAYTYCPACNRTTKDYGGKKHTYHAYGTLMSDVWRDISCDPGSDPTSVVARLQDVFGVEPYETLHVLDLRNASELRPGKALARKVVRPSETEPTRATRLAKGDCLEILRETPSNSVDFCFADPPYNLKKKYDNWDDSLDISEYFQWCDKWLSEMARVLKPGRTCAVLNIPQWAIRHFAHLRTVLEYQCWIVWEGLSLPVRMIMPAHYSIVCFSKGIPRALPGLTGKTHDELEREPLSPLAEHFCLRAACVEKRRARRIPDTSPVTDLWWDIHRLKHNSRRVDHPCQLPPALMRRLIALFTHEGECVLDPFNGAGTTTLAAEQLHRTFIGIELSDKYHALAICRHEELRSGLDPFRKTDAVPKAKNSHVKRLQKQRYVVSKKVLQLEVKRIAGELGHMPNREEVAHLSSYPLEYYEKYFISWGEVCAAARTTGMSEYKEDDPRARKANHLPLFQESR